MNLDDHTTELTLQDAAQLCGFTPKTLGRDRDERGMPMEMRGGKWWVTIGALISYDRYKPTEDGVSTRLANGKADACIITLETDLAEVRMRSEYQTQMIARLEDEIAFLRAQFTGLRAVA